MAVALALLVTACGGDDEPAPADGTPTSADGSPSPEGTGGVTEDACPDPVNPENGCIYLGSLIDLTEGPFAALGQEIKRGQEAFWAQVNQAGGIAGYDVDLTTYARDNKYDEDEHVDQFRRIEPNILALAQSFGTPTTLAALDRYQESNILAAPSSWWSGWEFEDVILQSGYNYCIEAMNGLDYLAGEADGDFYEGEIDTVVSVHYANTYGQDSSAGVALWAQANGVSFGENDEVETLPNSEVETQDDVVAAVVERDPDVVVLATGPLEAGEIIGKAVAEGFEGRFIGSVATWNPALIQNESLGPVLPDFLRLVMPWGSYGSDTPAHDAIAASVGAELPANDGYTYGWIWQYPLKAAIEAAAEAGDLTRRGLRSAVPELSVDYDGALPDKTYAGEPDETVVRQAQIARPDADGPLGLSQAAEFFTGPTAESFAFTEACSQSS